jgi:hypothetical protein
MAQEEERISEPYPVSDQYVSKLSAIEHTGQNLRFVLTTSRDREGLIEHEIVARIVMPVEAILPAIVMTLKSHVFQLHDIVNAFACITRSQTNFLN